MYFAQKSWKQIRDNNATGEVNHSFLFFIFNQSCIHLDDIHHVCIDTDHCPSQTCARICHRRTGVQLNRHFREAPNTYANHVWSLDWRLGRTSSSPVLNLFLNLSLTPTLNPTPNPKCLFGQTILLLAPNILLTKWTNIGQFSREYLEPWACLYVRQKLDKNWTWTKYWQNLDIQFCY